MLTFVRICFAKLAAFHSGFEQGGLTFIILVGFQPVAIDRDAGVFPLISREL